jgi:glycosyltransferase involved in cell wall biosynthesis
MEKHLPPPLSIDIVSSALNESSNVEQFYQELGTYLNDSGYSWRLLIADNGSSDDTWDVIQKLASKNENISGYKLSRNFGFEYAIDAVLRKSDADISIVMASDLQDHPKYLNVFLKHFEMGADHVFQVVEKRPGVGLIRRINTKIFYVLARKFSRGSVVPNAGDFRLFSRKFREALLEMPENTRFLRAMAMYPGFHTVAAEIPRIARSKGKSKSNLFYALTLGIKGVLANSLYLLDAVGIFSILFSAVSFLATIIFSLLWIFVGVPFAGFGTIVGVFLLGLSIIFLCLGLIAQYLSLIYTEVKKRPRYYISETV